MSRPTTTPETADPILRPADLPLGWTAAMFDAYTASPAARSAARVIALADELAGAADEYLTAGHPELAADVLRAAGVAVPDPLSGCWTFNLAEARQQSSSSPPRWPWPSATWSRNLGIPRPPSRMSWASRSGAGR